METEFSAGPDCPTVESLAVAEASGLIYVSCTDIPDPQFGLTTSIKRFHLDGSPANFSATEPYISGNTITANPGTPDGVLGRTQLAVDNSNAHPGFLYVGGGTNNGGLGISVFAPSGEWLIETPQTGTFPDAKDGLDVGPDGSIYVNESGLDPFDFVKVITKYDTSFHEVQRIYTFRSGSTVRVDSSGAIWARSSPDLGTNLLSKYEADQFSNNLGVGFSSSKALKASVAASTSPDFPDPVLSAGDFTTFDIDPTNGNLYVDRSNRIETYSSGSADEPPYQDAPSFGVGVISGSQAIAATADHHVYVGTNGENVVVFGPGDFLPDLKTNPAEVDDVGHQTATVTGLVDPAGGADVTSCAVEYGTTLSYGSQAPCAPVTSPSTPITEPTQVSGELTGLQIGTPYHFRFRAANLHGTNVGVDRIVVPAFVLRVKTLAPTQVDQHSAELKGSFDPDGLPTSYHFEYGVDTDYGARTSTVSQGSTPGVTLVSASVGELPAGTTIHFRLVANNENGTTYGADRTFRTASPPRVSGVRASDLASNSATLHARLDPVGYDTSYRFEFGPTPEYGEAAPSFPADIGPGAEPVDVSQPIGGLQPGITYHFRVVATNKWGTETGVDTTFEFSPPACPNQQVRQQTGSSYLPDCRAYELVSPADAGSAQMLPSQTAWDRTNASRPPDWAVNTGLATSPSRFAFFAGLGAIPGLDGPSSELDFYASTRTEHGWVVTLPALPGALVEQGFAHECSQAIDFCIDHDEGRGGEPGEPRQSSPHLFTAEGDDLGRLPTNLDSIPGGAYFTGAQRMSADFHHFVFSSTDVAFAPGGIKGSPGSAYDNDIPDHTVTVVSRLPNGDAIPPDSSSNSALEFPGLSPDGSHILMQTPGAHLYMRVDQSVTYDVSHQSPVTVIGMTRGGSKVFFIATQPLTTDDLDSSADLYMWSEAGELGGHPLTLLSLGSGHGNTDECSSAWTDACNVEPLSTERGHPGGLLSVPGLDRVVAQDVGDVYFYSPEVLDPSRPGVFNQRNLYVYRQGAVHLVATLDPGAEIDRMEVSPDGSHAAFLTDSKLTGYDNRGFEEMYTYDAVSGQVLCASCDPSGIPPSADVEASQGGPFMADDGRAFFSTRDSLVARDTDGEIIDVYEYAGGRPQLISSGRGARDFTGASSASLGSTPESTGLEAVSANGTDVYFSTFDSLVPQDQNGPFVKFYDARSNGGFLSTPPIAPCAAADECHGPTAPVPSQPLIATGAALGRGGNASPSHRSKAHRRARHRKHHQSGSRRHG